MLLQSTSSCFHSLNQMMIASVLPERRLVRSRSCKKRSNLPSEIHVTSPNLKRKRTTSSATKEKSTILQRDSASDCSVQSSKRINKKLDFIPDKPLRKNFTDAMVVGSQLDREIGTGESKQSTIKDCRKTQNGAQITGLFESIFKDLHLSDR